MFYEVKIGGRSILILQDGIGRDGMDLILRG